jgi:methionine aminopeptidase type I
VDDEALVKRLSGRRSCAACGAVYNVEFEPPRQEGRCDACGGELVLRPDDEPATVRRRLQVYSDQTRRCWTTTRRRRGGLPLDGSRPVEQVQAELAGCCSSDPHQDGRRHRGHGPGRVASWPLLHRELESRVVPGVSTAELDALAEDFIRSHDGAAPAFKGLYGFPASLCTSVNEEVVHGIPSTGGWQEGDIVSVDAGVKPGRLVRRRRPHVPVGEHRRGDPRLLDVTWQSLEAGIAEARPGSRRLGDIGHAIQQVAESAGFGVVRDLVGHGIGREPHEEPQVPNYGGPAGACADCRRAWCWPSSP